MLERKRSTAELVLAWDHQGTFKGGHLVRWDVVTDGAEVVSARQLPAAPLAGAVQPGLPVAEVLSSVQLDLARGLDAATRDLERLSAASWRRPVRRCMAPRRS